MRTNEEYKNLEAERDALILAVADHVTVRSEQYAQIQALEAQVDEMREELKYYANFGDDGVPVEDVAKAALDTPDDSAAILARRDAAIWRKAAKRL